MALGTITEYPTGLVSTSPTILYISTTDTYATVLTTGYLNPAKLLGSTFGKDQMALVQTSDDGPVFLRVAVTQSGGVYNYSLIAPSGDGGVTLPTITNHIIVSTNTTGLLANLSGTAINNGSLQAGLSGTSGTLISFPGTASTGSLILAAVANTGNTNVTISNALHGQASVYSIPDSGAATANLLVSKLTGTQHITVGALQVDAGIISSGISTGGSAGGFVAYPATTTNGSFAFTPVGNSGNFAAVVSPLSTLGQASTYTLPDPANAAARILVGATATPFTTGHLLSASGTGGLVADSGVTAASVSGAITQLGQLYQVSVTFNTAQMVTAYDTPLVIVAAPGSTKMIQVVSASVYTASTGNTPYATGTAPIIQYGAAAHGAGTSAVGTGLVAGDITAATSQVRTLGPIATSALTGTSNQAITFSNATGDYTAGTGTSVTITLVYQLLTATV